MYVWYDINTNDNSKNIILKEKNSRIANPITKKLPIVIDKLSIVSQIETIIQ